MNINYKDINNKSNGNGNSGSNSSLKFVGNNIIS